MWRQWKIGAGLALRLIGLGIVLSFLAIPAQVLFAAGEIVPAVVAAALAWTYLLLVIPIALPSVLDALGLWRMTDAETTQGHRDAVARK